MDIVPIALWLCRESVNDINIFHVPLDNDPLHPLTPPCEPLGMDERQRSPGDAEPEAGEGGLVHGFTAM